MATHVVVRAFPDGGRLLSPGMIVDASAWPNARLLVEQGYLAEAPAKDRNEAKPLKPRP